MTNPVNSGRSPVSQEVKERPLFRQRPYRALVILFLTLLCVTFKPWVHGIDGAGYYSWLRSFVIQGNLDTEDELKRFEASQRPDLQANVWKINFPRLHGGLLSNYYPVGSAVLWAPFFLAAHIIVRAANVLGFAMPADGYSGPYILLSMLGSAIWAFLGISIIYRIAARRFGPFAAGMAVGSVWLATPLVFYMFFHPAMSHANDVFVNALFLLAWLYKCRERKWHGWLLLGLAAGLAALVRTQNGLLVVFPCLELLALLARQVKKRAWAATVKSIGCAAVFAGGALFAFIPQMLVWKTVFGSFLIFNPQKSSLGFGFDFTSPHVWSVLLSTDRGLFVWSPVAVLCVSGIFLLFRGDRRLAGFLLCNFALQLYMIGSWSLWSGGHSFGPRFLLNCVPAFAIGLAAVLSRLQHRVPKVLLSGLCGAFVLWNLGLIAQYALQLVPRAGEVPLLQMIYKQFTVVPGKILGLIVRAVTRS